MITRNDQELKDIVAATADAVEEARKRLPEQLWSNPRAVLTQLRMTMDKPGAAAAKLVALIESCEQLGSFRAGWVLMGVTGGGHVVQSHMLPHALCAALVEENDPFEILSDAVGAAAAGQCEISRYVMLSGVKVLEPIPIAPNATLLPWSALPHDPRKREFENPIGRALLSTSIFDLTRAFGTAAIKFQIPRCQVLFRSHDEAPKPFAAGEQQYQDEVANDLVNCLAVVGYRPVAILGEWTVLESKSLASISSQGTIYQSGMFERTLQHKSHAPDEVDQVALAQLLDHWKQLSQGDKQVLRVALSRLHQAELRANLVDKALDLGVALEVILLHDQLGERGEMRFRVAVRGATFLGGSHEERVANLTLLKDAYDLRSSSAHTGSVPPTKRSKPTGTILTEASQLCARIARKVIERGAFPNWDEDYTIGGT